MILMKVRVWSPKCGVFVACEKNISASCRESNMVVVILFKTIIFHTSKVGG